MRHHRITRIAIVALILSGIGCFRTTVETGLAPSEQVVKKESASAWIGGLVGPEKVDAASACPSGVAKVQTQQSLLNQVVAYLTLGIYTPMTIRITCARVTPESHGASPGRTL
jgi:hypothetical protein